MLIRKYLKLGEIFNEFALLKKSAVYLVLKHFLLPTYVQLEKKSGFFKVIIVIFNRKNKFEKTDEQFKRKIRYLHLVSMPLFKICFVLRL